MKKSLIVILLMLVCLFTSQAQQHTKHSTHVNAKNRSNNFPAKGAKPEKEGSLEESETLCGRELETLPGEVGDVVLNGGNYSIPSTVVLYGNVVFRNANVVLGSGAIIYVTPNATVTIEGSHLYSCNEMWKGIKVQTGGYLKITGNDFHSSLIEDAITAVSYNFENSLVPDTWPHFLEISNTIFNKNRKSIQIAKYTNEDIAQYPFLIKNTVFTCRDILFTISAWPDVAMVKGISVVAGLISNPTRIPDNMASPYIDDIAYSPTNANAFLKHPYSGQKSEMAIELKEIGWLRDENTFAGIKIGFSEPETEQTNETIRRDPAISNGLTYNTNVIDNMREFGIYAITVNPKVVNTVFQKPYFDADSETNNCIGLYIRNDNVPSQDCKLEVIQETDMLPKNGFFDLSSSLSSNCEYNYVNDNEFRSTQDLNTYNATGEYGTIFPIPNLIDLQVRRNRFFNISNAVRVIDYNNQLGGHYPGGIDIAINRIGLSTGVGTTGNEVVSTGIWVSSLPRWDQVNYNVRIYENKITDAYNGIGLSDLSGKDIRVKDNDITLKHDYSTTEQYGIRCENLGGRELQVISNLIEGDDDGNGIANASDIVLANSSTNHPIVFCNRVKKGLHGLRFWSSNNLTEVRDNTIESSNIYGLTLDQNGYISPQGDNSYASGNVWEGDFDSYAIQHYKTACINNSTAAWSPLYVDDTDPHFDPSDNFLPIFVPSLKPYSNDPLYGTVIVMHDAGYSHCTARTVRTSAPIKVPFASGLPKKGSAAQNVVAHKGVTYNELIAQGALPLPGADSAQALYVLQQQLYAQLLKDSATLYSSNVLQNFAALNAYGSIGQLYDIESQLSKGDTTTAKALLTKISSKNVVEVNHVQYYQWLLDVLGGKGLQPADTAAIYALAQGCPATDGVVVYSARNLYNWVTSKAINFVNTCPQISSRKANNVLKVNKNKAVETKTDVASSNFAVYPNPSNGNLNLQLPQNGQWQITVTDQLGRISWKQTLTSNGGVINHQLNGSKGLLLVQATNLETGKQLVQKVLYK